MYTMVLMMAVGGSADATAFGGRKNKGCDGGCTGVVAAASAGCHGGSYLPAYTGCSGAAYAGCTGNSCQGGKSGGFLGGLFHRKDKGGGCHGTVAVSGGCHGYVAPVATCCPAPAPVVASCGGCGTSHAAPMMVSSPVMMGGPMMAAPCMTPGMAPMIAPAPTTIMPAPDKMPAATPETKPATPAVTPDKPAGGTKI